VSAPRLVLVGGGPACASVLMRLAARPVSGAEPGEVVLVDPSGETGGGEPYVSGTSAALLLNDPLSTMDATGIGFGGWLRDGYPGWWARLVADPDPRVVRWVRRNADAVRAGDWAGLFLPRPLVGDFLRQRVAEAGRVLAARGMPLRVVTGRVTALRPTPAGDWQVLVDTLREPCRADAVVLGVGSLLPPPPTPVAAEPGYFTYRRARDVAALASGLAALPAGPDPVVVLGSGAAAAEAVYLLEDSTTGELVVLSRSGCLPDGLEPARTPGVRTGTADPSASGVCIDTADPPASGVSIDAGDPPASGVCIDAGDPPASTAAGLLAEVVAVLARGRAAGHPLVDLLGAVRVRFDRTFAALPPAEKSRFVTDYAPPYRAAIRHISADYADAVRRLREHGRLTVRPGAVTAVTAGDAGPRVSFTQGGTAHHLRARAVVDCRGFVGVHATDHPVVVDLLASGVARANPCGRGLDVDGDLAAAPGLYVLGPALAGTAGGAGHIWSLENIPRIYALAERIAGPVRDRLRAHTPQDRRRVHSS
jgi:uncharacterized NAD(P)/FAD-binding protein YdhS